MGYRTMVTGTVIMRDDFPETLLEELYCSFFDFTKKDNVIEFYRDGNWHSEDDEKLFSRIAEYAYEGQIDCEGDDGYFWRYTIKDGLIKYHPGRKIFDDQPYITDKNKVEELVKDLISAVGVRDVLKKWKII